jgi:hypothetical protein
MTLPAMRDLHEMSFRFRNGSIVSLSPADGARLRKAAWRRHCPNAVTLLDSGREIVLGQQPVATGDELLRAAYGVDDPSAKMQRLRRELKVEFSASFVYRGFVSAPGSDDDVEFLSIEHEAVDLGARVLVDGRQTIVREIEPGPLDFDGVLKCEWETVEVE